MKLDNSNIFDTFSQLRSGYYNNQYEQVAKKADASVVVKTDSAADNSASDSGQTQSRTLTFDNMSKTQLSAWVTRGLDSGTLTEEQGQAFRVMLYSGKTESSEQQPQNDTEPVNFTEKAKSALSSAVQRNDKSSMQFWARALAAMNQSEGKAIP